MITAAQLRAARGLLDWTRADLAKAANISPETVKNIEHGTFRPQENTAEAIVRAFATQNVEFTDDEGVRVRKDTVTRYEGPEEFLKFMDDVYEVARHCSANGDDKPICVSNVDERLFIKYSESYVATHVQRMNKLSNIKVKVLVGSQAHFKAPQGEYIEYRSSANHEVTTVPFYVYGDKFAIILFETEPAPQVIVITSAMVAKAYRKQFEVLWQNAKPLGNLEV